VGNQTYTDVLKEPTAFISLNLDKTKALCFFEKFESNYPITKHHVTEARLHPRGGGGGACSPCSNLPKLKFNKHRYWTR
jgi:hypothetical protein